MMTATAMISWDMCSQFAACPMEHVSGVVRYGAKRVIHVLVAAGTLPKTNMVTWSSPPVWFVDFMVFQTKGAILVHVTMGPFQGVYNIPLSAPGQ